MSKIQNKQLYENTIKDSKNYPGGQREQFPYESMHVEEGMPSVLHLITSHDSVLAQKSLQFCISDHVFIFVSFYFLSYHKYTLTLQLFSSHSSFVGILPQISMNFFLI